MAVWLAEKALLPDGWANNVGITVSEEGIITALEKNAAPNPQATRIKGSSCRVCRTCTPMPSSGRWPG